MTQREEEKSHFSSMYAMKLDKCNRLRTLTSAPLGPGWMSHVVFVTS